MPPKGRTAGAKKVRRKEKKNVAVGQAHIKSTFNNTIISITDPAGAVIAWASAGQVGFKGSRKSTPFAAQMAAEAAARRAMEHGMRKVDVFVKGPGSGRETAIRSLTATGLETELGNSSVHRPDHQEVPPPQDGPRRRRQELRAPPVPARPARPSPDPGEGVPDAAAGEAARSLPVRRHGEAVRPLLQGSGEAPRQDR